MKNNKQKETNYCFCLPSHNDSKKNIEIISNIYEVLKTASAIKEKLPFDVKIMSSLINLANKKIYKNQEVISPYLLNALLSFQDDKNHNGEVDLTGIIEDLIAYGDIYKNAVKNFNAFRSMDDNEIKKSGDKNLQAFATKFESIFKAFAKSYEANRKVFESKPSLWDVLPSFFVHFVKQSNLFEAVKQCSLRTWYHFTNSIQYSIHFTTQKGDVKELNGQQIFELIVVNLICWFDLLSKNHTIHFRGKSMGGEIKINGKTLEELDEEGSVSAVDGTLNIKM